MGNEAVQVLKFVPISLRALRYPSDKIQTLSLPSTYCQFTALDIITSYSQQEFVEESETS